MYAIHIHFHLISSYENAIFLIWFPGCRDENNRCDNDNQPGDDKTY